MIGAFHVGEMASKPLESIDVSDLPDLLRIVDEVRAGARPRLLRRGAEPLAVLTPVEAGTAESVARLGRAAKSRRRRQFTAADWAAFRSAAGSWADVDTDKLIEDIYAARDAGDRPSVEL